MKSNTTSLLFVMLALAAMPVSAADSALWQGGAEGVWGTGYEGNWTVYPDSNHYAQFGNPYDTTITVTVNEPVDMYGIMNSSSRRAGINFTGTGTINNYRATIFADSGAPSLTDWDVNVDSKYDQWNTNIEGTNIFHKALNITGEYINTRDKAKVTLCDNAQMTAIHGLIVAGSEFEMRGSATAAFTKDLKFEPGASFRIADSAALTVRGLFLPFSQVEGTNEEWVMEGGEVRPSTADGNSRVEMAYTNATKTVSGTGTFYTYRFNLANSYNLVFRLMGPNMYVRDGYISSSSPAYNKNQFEIGGGSTIGLWGGDALFDRWTNRVVGAATVDTTDYADKTTPRTLTFSKLFDCNGVLTVKGVGTCSLSSPEQPNLNIVGTETSTTTCANGYALGDIVLTDSANFTATEYMGHKGEAHRVVKSITMDEDSTLSVKRYVILSGDAKLSGNASAVVCNGNGEANPIFTCANLSLSDDASLSVTGTIAAASLAMSGNARLAFTAGTAFAAGAAFGAGNWTMEITIPSGYEAGIRPVVMGAGFSGDFADHVTLLGDTTGWVAQTLDGNLVLYKEAPPSGIEWTGKSTASDNWSDAANWNGGNIPTAGDCVAFGGLDRRTPYNDSVGSVSSIVFRASAGSFVLSGANVLSLAASSGGRGSTTVANAAIVSHSNFDQTIESFVNFDGKHAGMISDGGGALKLLGGFTATGDWNYFVVGGDVRICGDCSVGILSFKTSATAMPSCLRVLPGGTFTCRNQYFRGFVESTSYLGRFVVEAGGTLVIQNGDCASWYGGLESVIDGTLIVRGAGGGIGRFVGAPSEQYYAGAGVIYADSARSARYDTALGHYINFGGTLKLYMNGDWKTASYALEGENVAQNPNYPSRFCMKDGTTLGATADWTYGPAADAYDVIANAITPDDRKSKMVGTVTVNTQNPTNDTAHTITFIDPLDASDANLVKAGAGTLVFNETAGYPSQVSNLTVNAGSVQFTGAAPTVGGVTVNGGEVRFGVAPTLSGTLTIASTNANFRVDGLAETTVWEPLATAADIVGPSNETKWKSASGMRRFKIVEDGEVKKLYGAKSSGFSVVVK